MVHNLGTIAIVTLNDESGKWSEVYAVYPDNQDEMRCQLLFGMS
jgi:hypothetical protein